MKVPKEFKKLYGEVKEYPTTASGINGALGSNYVIHVWSVDSNGNILSGYKPVDAVKFLVTERPHTMEEQYKMD